MLHNSVCALDIGSSKIAATVALVRKKQVHEVFFGTAVSKGIKNGAIVDPVELVEEVSSLLQQMRQRSSVKIKFVNLNISGQDIVAKHSRAILPLAERGSKVITTSDIQRVNDQARILGSSLDEEIVHVLPCAYSIDSRSNIVNPVGLYSHRLETDLYLLCGRVSSIQSLTRAIAQAGYEVKNLYVSGVATARAVFGAEAGQKTYLLCDIGSDVTEIMLFHAGLLKDTQILPIGGMDLTQRLQEALKIPLELAEEIKRSYGAIGVSSQIGEDKEILVKKSELYKPIKQKLVSEVITSAAQHLCSQIKEAVEKKIPTYQVDDFVVCGRSVLLEGLIETLENTLSIPVRIARITSSRIPARIKEDTALSGMKYLTYLTSLGIICEVLEEFSPVPLTGEPARGTFLSRVFTRAKEVYQEYF